MKPKIQQMIEAELERAKALHTDGDTIGGMTAIMEEVGEVAKAWNEYVEGKVSVDQARENIATEACHVAVTAIRLIEHVRGI